MGLHVMYVVKFKMCALKLLGDTNFFFFTVCVLVCCEVHVAIHNSVFRTFSNLKFDMCSGTYFSLSGTLHCCLLFVVIDTR
jgi:hypothetical protein